MNNPFTLSFGMIPEQFISRPTLSNRILDDFRSDKPGSMTYMLTGVRGSGKTVLLSEISKKLAGRSEWVVIELNPESDLMESLAARLYNSEKIKPLFLKAKINISFGGAGVSFESVNPGLTSDVAVRKMLDILVKHDRKLLIAIDEVANNQSVKSFVHEYQSWIRDDYPVYMVMTGLYDNIYNLQNEKTLTFLYRAPRIVLEPLNDVKIAKKYSEIFEIEDTEAARMAKLTKGYPFAFQVLGYIRWENKRGTLEELIPKYDQYLADYVYDKIWHELTEKDKSVVLELCGGDDYVKIATLREALGMTSSLFSSFRDKLIRKGIVDVSKYGYIGLVLPRFREYAIKRSEFDSL